MESGCYYLCQWWSIWPAGENRPTWGSDPASVMTKHAMFLTINRIYFKFFLDYSRWYFRSPAQLESNRDAFIPFLFWPAHTPAVSWISKQYWTTEPHIFTPRQLTMPQGPHEPVTSSCCTWPSPSSSSNLPPPCAYYTSGCYSTFHTGGTASTALFPWTLVVMTTAMMSKSLLKNPWNTRSKQKIEDGER